MITASNSPVRTAASRLVAFLAVPWAAFVGLFLYAVPVTLAAISVDQLPTIFIAIAYGAPVAGYALLLLARTLRALASLPIAFTHALPPHALPH